MKIKGYAGMPEEEVMSAVVLFRLRQKDREQIEAMQKELGHPTISYTIRYLLDQVMEEK